MSSRNSKPSWLSVKELFTKYVVNEEEWLTNIVNVTSAAGRIQKRVN